MALRLGAALIQKLNYFWANDVLVKGDDYTFEFQDQKKVARYTGRVGNLLTFDPPQLEFDVLYHTNYPEVHMNHKGVHIASICQDFELTPDATLNCPTQLTLNP